MSKSGKQEPYKRKTVTEKSSKKNDRYEIVDCPTCGNGALFNPSRCTLCKGKGKIRTLA